MTKVVSPGVRLTAIAVAGVALAAFVTAGRLAASNEPPGKQHCSTKTACVSVTNTGKGSAIAATAAVRTALIATTNNPSATTGYGANGILGLDADTDGGQQNIGVQGVSSTSNGVEGITTNPSLTEPFGRAAVFGIDASSDGGQRNWGTAGYSKNGTGILGLSYASAQTAGAPFASALLAVCGNGGSSIEAADGPLPTNNLFLLADCAGNITMEGTVTMGSPPLVVTKTSGGASVNAYAPRQTEPTIEDFGRAQLQNGSSHVPLGADFASTIARDANYLVLITPEGDSRGLYVAKKAVDGFDVRESQGGRSSIAFAYRIVAKPLGDREARLPRSSDVLSRRAGPLRHRSADPSAALRQIGGAGALAEKRAFR